MKRGGPLQRRTPLVSGGRIAARRPRRIDRESPEERHHKQAILGMDWCDAGKEIPGLDTCDGPLQTCHLGRGGTGQKRGNWTHATRLCIHHHDEVDGRTHSGRLGRMGRAEKNAYKLSAIGRARAFVAAAPPTQETL